MFPLKTSSGSHYPYTQAKTIIIDTKSMAEYSMVVTSIEF